MEEHPINILIQPTNPTRQQKNANSPKKPNPTQPNKLPQLQPKEQLP